MRMVIHGNCQAVALKHLVMEAYPDWDVTCFEVHQLRIDDGMEYYKNSVQNADIILSQPVSDDYRGCFELSHRWVKQSARSDAKVITFPVLYFEGYHPTSHFLYGRTAILAHEGWFEHFGDAVALKAVVEGADTDQIVERLLSTDLVASDILIANIARSLEELRNREEREAIDIRASPFISQNWRRMQLFHIVNHPCRAVAADVINQFFARQDLPGRVSPRGRDHWANEHFPSIPCVASLHSPVDLELTSLSASELERFAYRTNTADRVDYYRSYIAGLRSRDPADLECALGKVTPALRRLGF